MIQDEIGDRSNSIECFQALGSGSGHAWPRLRRLVLSAFAKHNTTCAPASLISIYNRGALSVFFFALGWVINIWWGMNKQASTLDCEPF